MRPLLSITFPQRILKLLKFWKSDFAKWGQKDTYTVPKKGTDGQTDKHTYVRTFGLIESISPVGRCFENPFFIPYPVKGIAKKYELLYPQRGILEKNTYYPFYLFNF